MIFLLLCFESFCYFLNTSGFFILFYCLNPCNKSPATKPCTPCRCLPPSTPHCHHKDDVMPIPKGRSSVLLTWMGPDVLSWFPQAESLWRWCCVTTWINSAFLYLISEQHDSWGCDTGNVPCVTHPDPTLNGGHRPGHALTGAPWSLSEPGAQSSTEPCSRQRAICCLTRCSHLHASRP